VPLMPLRQCDITSGGKDIPLCSSGPYDAASPPNFQAVRDDPGSPLEPIDAWNLCRYITNTSDSTSIFVPFNTSLEWQAFINNAPSFMSLNTCATPWQPPTPLADTTSGDSYWCGSPVQIPPPTQKLPYAPTSASAYQTAVAEYKCTCEDGTQWDETASQNYLPGDSDDSAPQGGWALDGNVNYSGTVPANCGSSLGTWTFWQSEPASCGRGFSTCSPDPCSPAINSNSCRICNSGASVEAIFICCSAQGKLNGTCPPPP
jgi:hypothetical protein